MISKLSDILQAYKLVLVHELVELILTLLNVYIAHIDYAHSL